MNWKTDGGWNKTKQKPKTNGNEALRAQKCNHAAKQFPVIIPVPVRHG